MAGLPTSVPTTELTSWRWKSVCFRWWSVLSWKKWYLPTSNLRHSLSMRTVVDRTRWKLTTNSYCGGHHLPSVDGRTDLRGTLGDHRRGKDHHGTLGDHPGTDHRHDHASSEGYPSCGPYRDLHDRRGLVLDHQIHHFVPYRQSHHLHARGTRL